jgi:hypothetical protein
MVRRTPSQCITVVALGGAALAVALVGPVGSTAVQAAQAADAERCVAIVLPSVRGADTGAAEMPQAIRELLVSYLSGPGLRSIPLEARLVTQAREEAKQKSCDHFLTLTATKKRGGGVLSRAIGTAATTAAWQTPIGRTAAGVGARSAALGGAYAVAEVAQNTKAKDEMTFEYQLERKGAEPARTAKVSAKAKTDGEDLLTPLTEQVATAVAGIVSGGSR